MLSEIRPETLSNTRVSKNGLENRSETTESSRAAQRAGVRRRRARKRNSTYSNVSYHTDAQHFTLLMTSPKSFVLRSHESKLTDCKNLIYILSSTWAAGSRCCGGM